MATSTSFPHRVSIQRSLARSPDNRRAGALGKLREAVRVRCRPQYVGVFVAFGFAMAASGCGSDEPEPIPPAPSSESTATAGGSPSPTETDDPGGAPAGWEDQFSDRQLRAYEAALTRWQRYDTGAGSIYAKGKNTAAARRFFKSNDLRPQERIALIEGIERAGIREVQAAKPLWTKAKSVKLLPDGTGTVLITQCLDYSNLRWEHDNGNPVKGLRPETLVTPLTIQMDKPTAKSDWLYANSEAKATRSCAG